MLSLNNNEVVKVDNNAHLLIIASMNPDIMGVNELQDSVRDRSNAVIYLDYPTVDREANLINKLIDLPIPAAKRFSEVITECRLLKTRDHQITKAPSTRGLIDWINYSYAWGIELAFELTIVNRYGSNEDERNTIQLIGQGKNINSIELPPLPRNSLVIENDVQLEIENNPTGETIVPDFHAIRALYQSGITVKKIADMIGKSTRTVYRYIKQGEE
jgi:hypothetical protein